MVDQGQGGHVVARHICTVNPGVKNHNRGRKLQEESNNTQRINDRAWKVDQ